MHVSYKLRKTNGLITPKGPRFTSSKKILSDIDGTIIKFLAPRHRPRHSNDEPIHPEHMYKMDDIIFRSNYEEDFSVSDNWETFRLFYNAWAFYGPWFTGTLAELDMYFTLIKPVNYKNEDFSLFNPRAFEKIIGDYLTNEYSSYTNELMDDRHEYITPANWQPLNTLPVIAARLQVIPDIEVARRTVRYYVFFPISDKVMASILFIPSQLLALSQEELDKRVNRSTMLELMENIIDSIELKLSPEATARQKEALAGLEDASLIKEFPPMQWASAELNNEMKELEKD